MSLAEGCVVIVDHDGGDEDRRRYVGEETCPFCGDERRRRWITPVFPYEECWASLFPAPLSPEPVKAERLVTCNDDACKAAARAFANAQRIGPRRREELRWLRSRGWDGIQ